MKVQYILSARILKSTEFVYAHLLRESYWASWGNFIRKL